jgi:hypothetical protein
MDVGTVLAGALAVLAVLSAVAIFRPRSATAVADAPPADPVRLAECERRLDSLFALRAEWTTYQEIIDDALEAVEVKRRRAAASASKRARTEPTPDELAQASEMLGAAPPDLGGADRLALRRAAVKAGRL